MLANNRTCRTLCTQTVPSEDGKFINDRIKEDYALNWLIDGLPAAEMKKDLRTGEIFFDMGFNLGNDEDDHVERPILNNNYDIYMQYHEPTPGVYRVVGVLVWPTR
jgi:transmembrane 9 superfamily member 2/4